ncbi:hypothetical protein [Dyadobacter endophyticus]|nr:hypothetical protein [Dyadobacter endophyticus]
MRTLYAAVSAWVENMVPQTALFRDGLTMLGMPELLARELGHS